MAAAGAIGLTLTAAVGAIAANTGLLGTASSAGRVGQLSPISVPGTSANAVPSSTAVTVDVEPLVGIDIPQPPAPAGDPAPTAAPPRQTRRTRCWISVGALAKTQGVASLADTPVVDNGLTVI